MPAKAHRTSALSRRSRNSSAGSSKLALNLQFTQKEAPPPPAPATGKVPGARTGRQKDGAQGAVLGEQAAPRTHSRTNSAVRVHSRERAPAPAPLSKRPAPQAPAANGNGHSAARGGKHKADFVIASPSTEDSDEDEWVSSEAPSGAATPRQDDSSSDDDADEARKHTVIDFHAAVKAHELVGTFRVEAPQTVVTRATPDPPAQAAAATAATATRMPEPVTPSPVAHEPAAHAGPRPQRQSRLHLHVEAPGTPDDDEPESPPLITPTRATRSETTSPTLPQGLRQQPQRQSLTRPPSTYSVKGDISPLRPHPLIRGHSYGRDSGATIAPLAPLTVTSDARAQISSSPPSSSALDGALSSSPGSVRTLEAPTQPPSPTHARGYNPLRRTSISSAHSAAPVPAASEQALRHAAGRSNHDRTRTLSTLSSSSASSLAALASFGVQKQHAAAAAESVRQALHLAVHFPPAVPQANLEAIHPLLPQPFLTQHLTLRRFRNPLAEAHERVVRAKQARFSRTSFADEK